MNSISIQQRTFTHYSYIVYPYIGNGDLRDLLNKALILKIPAPMKFAEYICRELLILGITHHGLGFAHRDIKPDNIVINKDFQLAYIDFDT